MAVLENLLKIRANVEGTGAVNALTGAIGGLSNASSNASKSLIGMAKSASMSGLGGALSSLIPLLSVGGIAAMANNAINAGDALNEMSQRTGVSVEMLARLKKAAALSGTSIEAVEGALMKLSRAMFSAAQQAGTGLAVERDMQRAVEAVRQGERQQTAALEQQAERRVQALRDESDDRLTELNRRYQRESQLLGDRYADEQNQRETAIRDQAAAETKQIQRQFDDRRRAIQRDQSLSEDAREQLLRGLQDQEEAALRVVSDRAAARTQILSRSLRDRQQAEENAIEDRKKRESDAIRASVKAEVDGINARAKAGAAALKAAADERVKAMQGGDQEDALAAQLDAMDLGTGKAAEAFRKLGISVKDQQGKMKDAGMVMLEIGDALQKIPTAAERVALAQQVMGRGAGQLVPMLLQGSEAIQGMAISMTTEFAAAADNYKDQLTTLSGKASRLGIELARVLLPTLEQVTLAVIAGVDAFNKMPGPLKATTLALVGLGLVAQPIAALVGILTGLGGVIAGLKIGATIAGWAGIVGPAMVAIKGFIAGLIAWVGSTAIPALAAFFSGPAGWTVLAVAAVVAMCIAFRKPIGDFLSWAGKGIGDFVKGLGLAIGEGLKAFWQWSEPLRNFFGQLFTALGGILGWFLKAWIAITWQQFVQPFIDLWNLIRQPVTDMLAWLSETIKQAFILAMGILWSVWVQPYIDLWNNELKKPLIAFAGWIRGVWTGIVNFFSKWMIQPIQTAWTALTTFLPNAMKKAAQFVSDMWNGAINGIKQGFRFALQYIADRVNAVGELVNALIRSFNKLPGPDIDLIPKMQVPSFATGGVTSGPMLARVGDNKGGTEYLVPSQKAAQFSQAFLSGSRGQAAIDGRISGGSGSVSLSITTGPVIQQDGRNTVTLEQAAAMAQQAAEGILGQLRPGAPARVALRIA